jgi:hypothetical protein
MKIECTGYKGYLLGYTISIVFFILLVREVLRDRREAGLH